MKSALFFITIVLGGIFLFVPFFLIQSVCLLVLILLWLSFLHSSLMRRSILAKHRAEIVRAYKNQLVEIRLELENTGLIPIHYSMMVIFTGQFFSDNSERQVIRLRGREKRTVIYRVQGQDRGEFFTGPVTFLGSDPLGFFPWQKKIENFQKIVVYPSVHSVALLTDKGLPAGNLSVQNPIFEDVTRFKSLREYIPGDDMRRVNWKALARTGKLFTSEFLPVLYFPSLIILNLTQENYPRKRRFNATERAIETAASLVFFCVEKKQEVGLFSTGSLRENEDLVNIPIRGSHSHAVVLLETLACINLSKQNRDIVREINERSVEIPWGTRIMYIGPPVTEDQLSLFYFLSRQGAQVELYLFGASVQHIAELSRGFRVYEIEGYGDEILE